MFRTGGGEWECALIHLASVRESILFTKKWWKNSTGTMMKICNFNYQSKGGIGPFTQSTIVLSHQTKAPLGSCTFGGRSANQEGATAPRR